MQSVIQICVKIDIKYIKSILLIAFLSCSLFLFANSVNKYKETNIVNKQSPLNIGGGVNLSLLEHTWEKPQDLLNAEVDGKLREIKDLGFKTVRLPVAFDLFLQPNSSNFQIEILDKIGNIYNTCEKLQLTLIVTYHYGKIYYASGIRYSERDRILWMWKQMQNKFKGMGYDKLFFDLYNEPTEERNLWKEDITYIVNGLRWEDKNRYYIVGGTNYNSIDEFIDLGKLDDDKLIYTFHFYEPFIFTHQGAEWTNGKTYIRDIPYPYNKKKMPELSKEAMGSSVEQDYLKYPAEGTKEYMALRLRKIADECKKNNIILICTETGVINLADEKYRNQYLEDVTSIMTELNIPVILWDYDLKFSILQKNGKPIKAVKDWLKCVNTQ